MNPSGRSRAPSRRALIVGLYAALAAIAVGVGAVRGYPNVYVYPGQSSSWRLLASPALGIIVGLAVVFASRWCVHHYAWARQLHRDFRGLLGVLNERDLLILAAASSVGEELLFRGALLPWIGIWPSTLIFALLHVGPGLRFLPWTFSALLAGLLFGSLFLWQGDLGGPIAAHFTVNFLNLRYIVRVELPAN